MRRPASPIQEVMANSRVLTARYAGSCTGCGASVAKGDRAWWDADRKQIWCLGCQGAKGPAEAVGGPPQRAPEPPPMDVGEAGRSAQEKFDRLHAAREQRIDETWGRLSGAVKFLTSDPQSTNAWAKGAEGERRVASHLQRVIGERAIFLHDRRIPGSRANIDLLVVAPSGVWIVDAKYWSGRVEHRDVGGWFSTDLRLYVGGRDRSKVVVGMERQVSAVSQALADPDIPILPALCFVEAEWGWFAKPFRFKGVWVTWAQRLTEMIAEPGPLAPDAMTAVAARLSAKLPAM